MRVLRPQRVDQWEVARPFMGELLDARDCRLRGDRPRTVFVMLVHRVAANPQQTR